MIQKSKLVPFQASPLPASPWLIISPQPLVELLAMGGCLLQAKKQNIDINLLIFTDKLSATKQQSIIDIEKKLGIKQIFFHSQNSPELSPDDKLDSQNLYHKVLKYITQGKPQSIFCPSFTEYSSTHHTGLEVVLKVLSQAEHFFSGQLFTYETANQQQVINNLINISDVIAEKQLLLKNCPHEFFENTEINISIAVNAARSYTLAPSITHAEAFYQMSAPFSSSLTHTLINQFQPLYKQLRQIDISYISIIVRTKDRLKLLRKTLLSIAEQSYQSIEVVIINDAGCCIDELLKQFENTFYLLKIHSFEKNQGRTQAANKGLELVTGEFILFLDDDDVIYPTHIESLISTASEKKVAVVYNNIETKNGLEFNHEFNKPLLYIGNYLPIHSVLFSRKFIDQGIRFDPNLNVYEDWDFWLQIVQVSDFYHVNTIGGFYTDSGDSTIGFGREKDKVRENQYLIYHKWLSKLEDQGVISLLQDLQKQIAYANSMTNKNKEIIENLQLQLHKKENIIEQMSLERQNIIDLLKQKEHFLLESKQINTRISEDFKQLSIEKQSLIDLIKHQEQLLSEKAETIALQEKTIALQEKTINSQNNEQKLIIGSLSWRITSPLRKFKQIIKRDNLELK
ncbi:MAG: glycosyltransferase [Pseudomonadota bacterium]